MNQGGKWNLYLLKKNTNLCPDSCELEEPEVWLCQMSRNWTTNRSSIKCPVLSNYNTEPENIISTCARINHTDPCRISALINTQLCVSTNSGASQGATSFLTTYHYHLTSVYFLTSLPLCLSSSRKSPMLGGFPFDLLSPFKECWPAACKTPGDLAVSVGIREYPTVANKPSNHMASKQKKRRRG